MTQEDVQALDIVAWVGTRNYKTPEQFISEGLAMGVSKRFGGGLPVGVVAGKTRVFLAHELAPANSEVTAEGEDIAGYIFAYFTVKGIMTVGPQTTDFAAQGLPVQAVAINEIGDFPERGCGYLVPGASYMVSEDDMKSFVKRENPEEVTGDMSVFETPISVTNTLGKYRGFRYINGDALLAGAPEADWMDIDSIKKSNNKAHKGSGEAAKGTVKEAIMATLRENSGKMDLESLIVEVRKKVPSDSSRARVMVRTAIGRMDRDGTLKLEKIETVSLPAE